MATKYDAIIIGTGQAGPSLAARLAGEGMKVAIIERKLFGGTCVNTGCIPTKPLVVHSQDIVQKGKSADRRQATQALMLPVMIIEVKPGAKPANTVA